MHAITYGAYGGADRLHIAEVAEPEAAAGEVLVDVEYAAVNPLDWKLRDGMMDGRMPLEFPVIPGCDGAGRVRALGDGVEGFAPGDRVFFYYRGPVIHHGTYAERLAVPAQALARVPDDLDLAAAASVPVAGLTAWQALHDVLELKPDDTLLVTAGAGGVGSLAIQLARHAGATVIATASAGNHAYMKELGADHVIDYRAGPVDEAVRAIVPEGCEAVLDCAGGEAYAQGVRALAAGGRIATIVAPPDPADAERGGYSAAFVGSQPNGEQLGILAGLLAGGQLRPAQIDLRSVRDAATAQDESKAGHTRGKLVLKIDF